MADYTDIIVGAGSAGAVLASRLSADQGRSVLLLEAGPDYAALQDLPAELRDGNTPVLSGHGWGLRMRDGNGRDTAAPRGKVIGGSSAVNTCIALRPLPGDFDRWPADWSWRTVAPYLERLEHDLDHIGPQTRGPIPVRRWREGELESPSGALLDACREADYPEVPDLNAPGASGVGLLPMNMLDGVRKSTASTYLAAARARPNLTVRANCLVDRVVLANGRAIAVDVEDGGRLRRLHADRVTLCAGTYGTPAILLRSGIGAASSLRELDIPVAVHLPGVGRNLQDHSQCSVAVGTDEELSAVNCPCVQVLARYTATDSAVADDMQICVLNRVDLAAYAPEVAARVGALPTFMTTTLLQAPQSRGRLTLPSADPRALPTIWLNYCAVGEDLRRYRDGMRRLWELLADGAFGKLGGRVVNIDDGVIASDDLLGRFVRSTVQTAHHPVGTARMGSPDDRATVVDSGLLVHGTENLRVADASVMPEIVRANTNLTCVMIGERAADLMLSRGAGRMSS